MIRHRICLSALLGVALAACSGSDDSTNPASGGSAGSTSQPDAGTEPDGGQKPAMAKSSLERDPASAAAIDPIVEADNAFAFDLYAKVRAGAGTDNMVMS
ncbi:MAG: hypothetical protein ACOC1F_11595, partial [Myxococcota bacterium]